MILGIFVLIRVLILSIFVLKGYLFLDDKQPVHMFYVLNYSKIFTRPFGLNVLNGIKNWNSVLHRVGKSAIFVLNRVRV